MNKIQELFGQLQSDIKSSIEQFDCNTSSTLGITLYSSHELIEMGFVAKNIEKVISSVSNSDVEEFFDIYIKDLNVSDLGSIVVEDGTGISTISQFIFAIKRAALYKYLNKQLSHYLTEIKGDKDANTIH